MTSACNCKKRIDSGSFCCYENDSREMFTILHKSDRSRFIHGGGGNHFIKISHENPIKMRKFALWLVNPPMIFKTFKQAIGIFVDETHTKVKFKTRVHSSRMRTARLLSISPSIHYSGGEVPAQGGVPAGGVPAQRGCTCRGGVPAQVLSAYEQND